MSATSPLDLTPLDRLTAAARVGHRYVRSNFGEVEDEEAHARAVTSIHEAGHAVAMTLAGARVTVVYGFAPNGCSVLQAREEGESLLHICRGIPAIYAGPVAELRHDPRRVWSGMSTKPYLSGGRVVAGDMHRAEAIAVAFDRLCKPPFLLRLAWREACRMMADPDVWAAVTEIAAKLDKSRAARPSLSGATVRKIVAKHLPNGWDWLPPFEVSR